MMNQEFNLKRSEIKKVNKLARKLTNEPTAEITGWFTDSKDEWGFRKFICEICYGENLEERADIDIVLEACMFDRIKSWVRKCEAFDRA